MAKNTNTETVTTAEPFGSALTRAELFIDKYQKAIIVGVIAVVVVVGGYLGYRRLHVAPMEAEAQAQSFAAEQYFATGQYELALNGDGNFLGFLDIIANYGPTKTGNLAHYYAGISSRNLGKFQEAIDHLKEFRTREDMVGAVALGAIGDSYVELGNLERGVRYYQKAIRRSDNSFTTPIFLLKAGIVHEELGDFGKALEMYNTIKSQFPRSTEAREIEKYIARAQMKLEQ